MSKRFWRNALILILGLLAMEIALRLVGFGKIPCYYKSLDYEYALKPNQEMTRFGSYIYINSQGMRSDELRTDAIKILKFGDSVLNGGVAADQSELTSTLLEKNLNRDGSDYQVLNVSAGSWGPDNAFAWMQKHGDFDASIIVLLFSSHDWQDQMSFEDKVGNTPYYLEENPALAITDAFYWAYTRMFDTVNWNELGVLKGSKPNNYEHNLGWDDFVNYTSSHNIPLLVYHHADRSELENQSFSEMGLQLQAFLNQNEIPVISGLEAGFEPDDYHDGIHPKPASLAKIERAILPEIHKLLGK